jgi:hypothetical protein
MIKVTPFRIGIFIICLFGLLLFGMHLWRPLQVKYYMYKYYSGGDESLVAGVDGLLSLGPEGEKALLKIFDGDREREAVDLIKNAWPDVNNPNYYERTGENIVNTKDFPFNIVFDRYPLFDAVIINNYEFVRILIAKGADLNRRSEHCLGPDPLIL